MKSWQYLSIMVLVALFLGIWLFSIAGPREKTPLIKGGWHYEDAPEQEPIIGVWGLGYATRAHVCVMIEGSAYTYGEPNLTADLLETVRPRKWRRMDE